MAESAVEGIKTDSKKKIEDVESQASKEIKDAVEKAKKQAGNELVSLIEGKEADMNRLIEEYQRKIDALPDPIDLQQGYASGEEIDADETSQEAPESPEADIYAAPTDGEEIGKPTTNE